MAEERRREYADRDAGVDVVDKVLDVETEAEIPGASGLGRLRRIGSGGSLSGSLGVRRREHGADLEGLVELQLEEDVSRAGGVVDRDAALPGNGLGVEVTVAGSNDGGAGEIGGEARAIVVLRVSIEVGAGGDVEELAGTEGEEGAAFDAEGEMAGEAKVELLMGQVQGAAIVGGEVVLVGRKDCGAACVGADGAGDVEGEDADVVRQI